MGPKDSIVTRGPMADIAILPFTMVDISVIGATVGHITALIANVIGTEVSRPVSHLN